MAVVIPVGFAELAIGLMDSATGRMSSITFGVPADDLSVVGNLRAALEAYLPDVIQDCHTDISAVDFNIAFGEGSTPGAGSVTVPFSAPMQGGQGGERMTPQVAYLVRKQTASLGRGTSGRWFLPGVKEALVDGAGTVDPDFLEDMNNHLDSFVDGMKTTGIPLGPWPVQLLTTNNGALEVIRMVGESKVATQRRRLVRS